MVKSATKPAVHKHEEKYRVELFPDIKSIINKNLLCTSCNCSVRQLVQKGKPRSHPFLNTLLCEKCHTFYGDGEFSVDEDGSDKYCRWCGQGGTLYLCSKCTAGFCKKCIKRNLPRAVLKDVEEDDWECFSCNVKPLYELRAYSWAAQNYAKTIKDKSDSASKKRKGRKDESEEESSDNGSSATAKKAKKEKESSDNENSKDSVSASKRRSRRNDRKAKTHSGFCSDESAEEESSKVKKSPSKSKDKLKIKQMKLGRGQVITVLQDLVKLNDIAKSKASDFHKKKVTPQKVHDLESFKAAAHTVTGMLQSVEDMAKKLRLNFTDFVVKFEETVTEMDGKEKNGINEDEEKSTENNDNDEELKADSASNEKEESDVEMKSPDDSENSSSKPRDELSGEKDVDGIPKDKSEEPSDDKTDAENSNENDEGEAVTTEAINESIDDKPADDSTN